MSLQHYMYIGDNWITTLGQFYDDSERFSPCLMELNQYMITINDLFEIDAERTFNSIEAAERYIKKQVKKKCKEILKELEKGA